MGGWVMADFRRGGRRPDYNWNAFQGTILTLDNALGTDDSGTAGFGFGQAGTLVRMRGIVGVHLDSGGVEDSVLLRYGIIKVSENAAAAGIASVPNPFDDPGEDWIWMGHAWVTSGAEAAVATDGHHQRVEVDSKAMRKFKASETLVFVASVVATNDQGGSTDSFYSVRLLQSI